MQYIFDWDQKKAKTNRRKHKISFERAAFIFKDPLQISIHDEEHSGNEDRWITIGKNSHEIILVVIHTFEEIDDDKCRIRIISSRKATKKESKQYEDFSS